MPAHRCRFILIPAILTVTFGSFAEEQIEEVLDVGLAWSGHPVGFDLLTGQGRQFVAFYDAERRLTVASRKLGSKDWRRVHLPEKIGWDSHNYVTMHLDKNGFLHLSGNMHCDPLVYFRTEKPLDIDSFVRVPEMIGENEASCTYPKFMTGPDGELLFTYRDGSSGNGNQIWNVYDRSTKTWRRLMDKPLTSGGGKMNAYFHGPRLGPDGYYHLCWVWRDTPDCKTNHDLSYARSEDLIHWETSAGKPLELPITLERAEIVDPVPAGGGIINGNTKIGFDSKKRPIIAYHKYDEQGNTQVYNARLEDGQWRIYPISDWDYRWAFSGSGAIGFEIHISAPKPHGSGRLAQSYSHKHCGAGTWLLDEDTMERIGEVRPEERPALPRELTTLTSDFPGMQVRRRGDSGNSGEAGVHYVMKWESLGANRDRPRKPPLPEPSMLRVYKLRR